MYIPFKNRPVAIKTHCSACDSIHLKSNSRFKPCSLEPEIQTANPGIEANRLVFFCHVQLSS